MAFGRSPSSIDSYIQTIKNMHNYQDAFSEDLKSAARLSGSSLINAKSTCYNSGKHSGGGMDMSFVGGTFFEDKIIVYADSKSTLLDVNGNPYEDIQRGLVNKIMLKKNYAMVMHGLNKLIYTEAGNQFSINVEDWISLNADNMAPLEMMQGLLSFLIEKHINTGQSCFSFMFFYKKNQINVYEHYNVSSNGIRVDCSLPENDNAVYAGDNRYVDYFNLCAVMLMDEDEECIKKNLEKVIEWNNKHRGSYNPVGLPVNVATWYPPV